MEADCMSYHAANFGGNGVNTETDMAQEQVSHLVCPNQYFSVFIN
jgi:hypothetical protein